MTEENKRLVKEIEELNNKLDKISNKSKFMIYSANPFKFAFFNFISGMFHFMGVFFGMFLITGVAAYLLSQFQVGRLIDDWMVERMTRWQTEINRSLKIPSGYVPDLRNNGN